MAWSSTSTSGLGVNSRRIAAEGERVHAATLYFDVREEAAAITSTALTVSPVTGPPGTRFAPWVRVRWLNQSGLTVNEVQADVAPIIVSDGRMAILPQGSSFIRGDSNTDLAVDLSDAVFTIDYLFLSGQPPLCPEAADANGDGSIDLTDPVVTLGVLFLAQGSIPPPYPDPGPYTTITGLGCY
jgi:dockerin type I repeat protein